MRWANWSLGSCAGVIVECLPPIDTLTEEFWLFFDGFLFCVSAWGMLLRHCWRAWCVVYIRSFHTESSFPIELAGVYSTIELDAGHFQLSSTQLGPIPEAFSCKKVYSGLLHKSWIAWNRLTSVYSGPSHTSISGPPPRPLYLEWIILIIPSLFQVYSGSIP